MKATIKNPISCYGIGVHSGKKTQLTLKPAKPGTGVVFVRSDVTSVDNKIVASCLNVSDTTLSTSIKNDAGIKVSTIEHIMAAIWGSGVSDLIVEIDGPEVPIMDGSSKPFVFMLECGGAKLYTLPTQNLKILKEIRVTDNGSEIVALPSDKMIVDLTIDFNSPVIGKQQHRFSPEVNFNDEIADSRTFGFVHELEYLKSKGLAQGASLDNAIGIDQDKILNHDGLRHKNEFVRHKLLDLLGDLFTVGGNIVGEIYGYKTSHNINNLFLRNLLSDPTSYRWE